MKLRACFFIALLLTLPLFAASKPNVLFISIDDLRPELGCYGEQHMVTPNLDRLAAQGRLFRNHYVQVPTCGASRYALLTGRYPQQPAALSNNAFALAPKTAPAVAYSLPMLFKQHGYETVSLGKITHSPDGLKGDDKKVERINEPELPFSWSTLWGPSGPWQDSWRAFFGYAGGKTRDRKTTPAFEHADVPDEGYPDGRTAEEAIRQLNRLKDKPFFLAVGFFKPHLPFNAPKKYWDLYDAGKLPRIPSPEPPANVNPRISLHKGGELFGQYAFDGTKYPDADAARAANLRHAYYAAVSYSDAQVGRLLAELDRLGLSDNTIVVAWGDHGWHLGDNGVWGKHTLNERALHSALIIRTPGMKQPGKACEAIVETVDLFPTIAELAGLSAPKTLDGLSILPMLQDPNAGGKDSAHSFWRNNGNSGQSIRTERYRLIRWINDKTKEVAQVELYDHQNDDLESKNIAADNPEIVKALLVKLLANHP
jgi:iduronate 2-sulfatase